MKYYAGLDIAMKETCICIVDETGKRVHESKSLSDPDAIHQKLLKSGYALEKVGLESGSISHYLTKGLRVLGYPAICIDARKMAAILSVTINKTDKNDARGIADAMRCNHYKEVHVRDLEDRSISVLLKSRATLVKSRTMLKNTVRGHLKLYGIRLSSVSDKKFSSTVRSRFPDFSPEAMTGIESLLVTFETVLQEIDKTERALRTICEQDEEVKRLMTIPGVGMIVALAFKTDIGDPRRFKKSDSVGAYYGMTPRQYSSGETVKQGRISRCGDQDIRTLLNEAAMSLLTRVKTWSSLKAWGLKVLKKHGMKKAAMAVGRKLAVIMHRMMIEGESFRYGKAGV